ncbi:MULTISPECIES: flagellin [unclassified Bradyrhizobium]|uniref:flagellin n=1 Tax=unclassified Bradyrhizobium TaxID=2631580 RepID=UPI0028E576A9|nr:MULTISPECIES: flagellin [unclassified Bradyrhizobium]
MSGIVLSASARQNLLALQNTAQLLATTQNNLATGNKVNTALDNPTEFFTAQGLNNRASDIANLLDGIGNGVQVLQAANTGITSLQKLVDSAKSIANQVLQTAVGYATKSTVTSTALTGANASSLLGATTTAVTGTAVLNDNLTAAAAITSSTKLSGTASSTSNDLATAFTTTDTLTVNGTTFTFIAGSTSSGTSIGIGDTVGNLLSAIQTATGISGSISASGAITLTPPPTGLTLSGSAGTLAKLGLSQVGDGLAGQTLTIAATGGGTPTSITFGIGTGKVNSLNDLNAALAANNLQASVDTTGKIAITTINDAASSTIGAIGGTAAAVGQAFNGLTGSAPVIDVNSQAVRSNLVTQYNNVLSQINTTAVDASFNGINLLNGDTLKLVFDETGKSTLSITGVTFNITGLGLSPLASGVDFLDSSSANKILNSLQGASTTLRSEASALGSNLSIVQVRQDFNKNLINVLQTGSSNLTLADTNQEAANSQALSTRQSIAVSALALANQSQASVLQLLR